MMSDTSRQTPQIIRALFYTLMLAGIAGTAYIYWQSQASSDYSGIEIQPLVPLDASTLDPSELTKNIAQLTNDLVKILEQIQDEADARNSEPAIEDTTQRTIALKLERIPESIQVECLPSVKQSVEGLMQTLKRQYKIPGVQAILEPMVSPMLSRLQAFAKIQVD